MGPSCTLLYRTAESLAHTDCVIASSGIVVTVFSVEVFIYWTTAVSVYAGPELEQ